ncbi:MAG: tyrosine-type recombinase/integrase [Patescibacteria group bacterium]
MIKLEKAHKSFVDHLQDLKRSESTIIAYSKDVEQLIEHLLEKGVNLVHEIETHHLEDFMGKLANESYTPKSISRKTNSTKTFFRFLIAEGYIEVNAADQLKHPKVEVKAPRILSRLEYGALRDVAKEDNRTFAIIEVLLQTGIRISELAQIKLEDVDLKNGTLTIPERGNNMSRRIPLNKAVVSAISSYLEERPEIESEYLFITKTGRPLLVRNIRATIDRYFKTAGISDAKVNDLRHTFVAFHLAQGTNLLTVSKIAGHKRISTTERYLEYIEKVTEEEKTELGVL